MPSVTSERWDGSLDRRSPTAKMVLVVEDDPDHRRITATILRHHGYSVLEAADGGEGLTLAASSSPDLILMDARLPGLDGWTATSHLKVHGDTAHIPIIIFTAHVLASGRLRSKTSGADGYLPKPCAPEDIVAEVRRWIGQAVPPPAPA